MSEWRESTLGEQINLKRGYDLPSKNRQDGTIPIFSSSGISGSHREKMSDGPGVITGRYGTIGQVFYSKGAYWPLNTTLYVQNFKGNDTKFIYYFLQQLDWAKYSDKSAVPGVNRNDIHQEPISIPPLFEQKAIAAVLSSLDDKIDLLHRQNQTLEAMAATLFRQWFVEEAQEDWKLEKLGDCVTISYGKNLPTKNLLSEGFPVFGANGQIGFYDRYTYEDPQVLVSCRGEASGKVNISLPKSFVTNNSLALERNKRSGISFEFLKYWALSYDFNLHVSGSAQPQITIDGLYDAEFIFPSAGRISKFTDTVRPIEEKRYANDLQIRTLEKLRDNLLPKLMSGEVRVEV